MPLSPTFRYLAEVHMLRFDSLVRALSGSAGQQISAPVNDDFTHFDLSQSPSLRQAGAKSGKADV